MSLTIRLQYLIQHGFRVMVLNFGTMSHFTCTMILAVNRRFFPKGPKIASDKSAFLYCRLTEIHLWIIRPIPNLMRFAGPSLNTRPSLTYLGLWNRVRVTVSISVSLTLVLGLFVKAPSSVFNQAQINP